MQGQGQGQNQKMAIPVRNNFGEIPYPKDK